MRLAQVNRSDVGGGAEKITLSLHRAYLAKGLRSWIAVEHRQSDSPGIIEIPHHRYGHFWARFWHQLSRPWRKVRGQRALAEQIYKILSLGVARPRFWVTNWLGHEDFDYAATRHLLEFLPEPVDLIHGHNLHGRYFDLRALPELSHQVPVVLTLHDAWLLSGHCAHSFDCDRWQIGCGQCPDLGIIPPIKRDATRYNWHRKQEIYARSKFYIATPSQWLMDKVNQSILAPAIADRRVIPNGIDISIFQPSENPINVRRDLRLPPNAKILLFTANSIRHNPWKDFQMLRRALIQIAAQLPNENIIFLALGEDAPTEHIGSATICFIPYQTDDKRVAAYYQVADVYLHAAKADTFPNTVLEALACGTPVVATAVGGIPEQVFSGKTGILVAPGDVNAMVDATVRLLKDTVFNQQLSYQARQQAVSHFGLERMACNYTKWYQEILRLRAT